VQRHDLVLVELERHLREAVRGEVDLLDHPDPPAADLDGVALDELAGVRELRADDVGVVAAREHDGDRDHRGEQRGDRDDDGLRAPAHPPIGLRGFEPQKSCVPSSPMRWMPMMFATIDCAVARPTPTGPPAAW
jgi:hypothetical protein